VTRIFSASSRLVLAAAKDVAESTVGEERCEPCEPLAVVEERYEGRESVGVVKERCERCESIAVVEERYEGRE
jgi:hypothetical protein